MKTEDSKGHHMTEQEQLYKIIREVSATRADLNAMMKSSEELWRQFHMMRESVNVMNSSIQLIANQDGRIAEVEEGVRDWRNFKLAGTFLILGISIGGGALGATVVPKLLSLMG